MNGSLISYSLSNEEDDLRTYPRLKFKDWTEQISLFCNFSLAASVPLDKIYLEMNSSVISYSLSNEEHY